MRSRTGYWLFVAVVVIIPFSAFSIVKWYESKYEKLPVLGPEGHVVGNLTVTDQRGDAITADTLTDKIVVANFFFSHCPVICPKMIRNLKSVQQQVSPEVLICSISVDPERDDAQTLTKYAAKMGIDQNWLLLTGYKKDIYRFARKELFLVTSDGDGGDDDFIHSDNFVLLDRQRRIRGYYKGIDASEVKRLINDIKKLQP